MRCIFEKNKTMKFEVSPAAYPLFLPKNQVCCMKTALSQHSKGKIICFQSTQTPINFPKYK